MYAIRSYYDGLIHGKETSLLDAEVVGFGCRIKVAALAVDVVGIHGFFIGELTGFFCCQPFFYFSDHVDQRFDAGVGMFADFDDMKAEGVV